MKKMFPIGLTAGLCAGLAGCRSAQNESAPAGLNLWPIFFVLLGLCFLGLAALRTYSFIQYARRRRRRSRRASHMTLDLLTFGLYALGGVSLLAAILTAVLGGLRRYQ